MRFLNDIYKRKKVPTSTGSRWHVTRMPRVLDDGTVQLRKVDKEDITIKINSYLPFTDMAFILNRLQAGDTSVLNRQAALYGDFSKMPSTRAGMLDLVLNAENEFLKLPLDVRNAYNNDWKKWLCDAGSKKWLKTLGIKPDFGEPKVVVKSDEIPKEDPKPDIIEKEK